MNKQAPLSHNHILVIDKNSSFTCNKATFRRSTPGPESNLVDTFLKKLTVAVPNQCKVTIFKEPRLESGYPDIVAVVWDVSVTANWNKFRIDIRKEDLKILHYLTEAGPHLCKDLKIRFGKGTAGSLERLGISSMVQEHNSIFSAEPLSSIFAVKQIIAFEAKINSWKTALRQAHLNTWFASNSYIVLPRVPKGSSLLLQASHFGVGVKTLADNQIHITASASQDLPLSYASWLFNEWVWRYEHIIL